jgi:hypothetical protein
MVRAASRLTGKNPVRGGNGFSNVVSRKLPEKQATISLYFVGKEFRGFQFDLLVRKGLFLRP